MAFNPHRARIESVTVEYNCSNGKRESKTFRTNAEARSFYKKMLEHGRDPKVVSAVATRGGE